VKQNNITGEVGDKDPTPQSQQTTLDLFPSDDVLGKKGVATKKPPTRHEQGQGLTKALYPQPADLDNSGFNHQRMLLFQTFLCNTDAERDKLSNTVELWDSIPRYSITRRQQNALRDEKTGTLPIQTLEFNYLGEAFRAQITPAKILESGPNGSVTTIEYYPSNREELVEDALRKIASNKSYGFFLQDPVASSGVAFTLYELRIELAERGHGMTFAEITQSLMILHKSSIAVFKDSDGKTGSISSNYFPVLMTVTRKQFDADPTSKWVVHFHPFITQGIATIAFRQFNYETMMSLSTQLCRWLHKYICMKFTQASMITPPFKIHYKTIKRDSGLLKAKHEPTNYADVVHALDELKEKYVLYNWTCDKRIGPRGRIIDMIYSLSPSVEFVREAKAANRRRADANTHDGKRLPPK